MLSLLLPSAFPDGPHLPALVVTQATPASLNPRPSGASVACHTVSFVPVSGGGGHAFPSGFSEGTEDREAALGSEAWASYGSCTLFSPQGPMRDCFLTCKMGALAQSRALSSHTHQGQASLRWVVPGGCVSQKESRPFDSTDGAATVCWALF